jgi:HAD superfamily hydrolase (TIGR01458 family)
VETTRQLKARGIPYRFATNNTTESIATMSRNLQTLGLEVPPDTIITASYAAVLYLRQKQYSRIYPLMTDDARTDFQEFTFDDMEADAVVIGDMENNWNYRTLNRAFKLIRQGAEPVALHKSKFWQWEAGLQLDIGAFVVGLEYATDTPATIVGKPSASFFELALQELNLPAEEVIMVGDDIDADVAGAQSAGLRGALVKPANTGSPMWHLELAPMPHWTRLIRSCPGCRRAVDPLSLERRYRNPVSTPGLANSRA